MIWILAVFGTNSKIKKSFASHRSDQSPNVNVPFSVENDPTKENQGAKLHLGAIVALGAFGGFIFLTAVITTIYMLVRRLVNLISFLGCCN